MQQGIGAENYKTGGSITGRGYVFHGSETGIGSGSVEAAAANTIITATSAEGGKFGTSVVAGLINSDVYADAAFGAYNYDNPSYEGKVYIFHGSSPDGIGSGSIPNTSANTSIIGGADEYIGSDLALGDYNRDGYSDLCVAAVYYQYWNEMGKVYVFKGEAGGINTTAVFIKTGGADDNNFGAGIGFCDTEGDGYADLIIGEMGYSSFSGQVHLFESTAGGINVTSTIIPAPAGGQFGISITR